MTLTDNEVKKLTNAAYALGKRDGLAAIPREPKLVEALSFYASKGHLWGGKVPDDFDTCSGEPQNWWFGDECPEWGVEDGTIAAMALRGQPIDWDDDPPPALDAAQGGKP